MYTCNLKLKVLTHKSRDNTKVAILSLSLFSTQLKMKLYPLCPYAGVQIPDCWTTSTSHWNISSPAFSLVIMVYVKACHITLQLSQNDQHNSSIFLDNFNTCLTCFFLSGLIIYSSFNNNVNDLFNSSI